jgi:hypothetical protein
MLDGGLGIADGACLDQRVEGGAAAREPALIDELAVHLEANLGVD